jgi:hypothetical protein
MGLKPRLELFPCPTVRPNFAAFAAFAVAEEDRAWVGVEVTLVQVERFADS